MTNTKAQPVRELFNQEIDHVSGGMKWVPGTRSGDVIDARGGWARIFIWRITLDINGKISSFDRL